MSAESKIYRRDVKRAVLTRVPINLVSFAFSFHTLEFILCLMHAVVHHIVQNISRLICSTFFDDEHSNTDILYVVTDLLMNI